MAARFPLFSLLLVASLPPRAWTAHGAERTEALHVPAPQRGFRRGRARSQFDARQALHGRAAPPDRDRAGTHQAAARRIARRNAGCIEPLVSFRRHRHRLQCRHAGRLACGRRAHAAPAQGERARTGGKGGPAGQRGGTGQLPQPRAAPDRRDAARHRRAAFRACCPRSAAAFSWPARAARPCSAWSSGAMRRNSLRKSGWTTASRRAAVRATSSPATRSPAAPIPARTARRRCGSASRSSRTTNWPA